MPDHYPNHNHHREVKIAMCLFKNFLRCIAYSPESHCTLKITTIPECVRNTRLRQSKSKEGSKNILEKKSLLHIAYSKYDECIQKSGTQRVVAELLGLVPKTVIERIQRIIFYLSNNKHRLCLRLSRDNLACNI